MIPFEWITEAAGRIRPHIIRTPLTHDAERGWFFKWENRQVTGSFKVRGALNKALSLLDWERQVGLVAASAGNHGQGLALAGRLTGAKVEVFVPDDAPPVKVTAMRDLGAQVYLVAGGYAEAEARGREYAQAHEKTWVSPYNDAQVVAGQGTLGLELLETLQQHPQLTLLVPVSGGGLLAGIAAAVRGAGLSMRLLGVQPENAAFMHALFRGKSQSAVTEQPTLADGLAGAVEDSALTIPIVRAFVDDILLVSEEAIGRAVAFASRRYGERIEPSAAVGLAALLSGQVSGPALVVVSGGNVQPETHAALLARYAEGE